MNKSDDLYYFSDINGDTSKFNMNKSDDREYCNDFNSSPELTAAKYLWKICPPILLLFGTIGNILAIIILRRPDIRKSVCSVYFITLAVSDLLVLYTGLLRQWIYRTFDVDIRDLGPASCKIHSWIVYFLLDFSSWTLVAVTVERVLLVWIPRKTKVHFTKQVAVISLLILATCLLLVNSHILYGRKIYVKYLNNTTTVDFQLCYYISNKYKEFWYSTWPSVHLVVFCGIPFCFLLVGNLLIFIKVLLSKRGLRRQNVRNSSITRQQSDPKFSSMSFMLMTVNTMFLVCNTPINVYMIRYNAWQTNYGTECHKMQLVYSVANILMYLNNSINFLLYILSGSRFRNEIRMMLRRRSRHIATSVSHNKITGKRHSTNTRSSTFTPEAVYTEHLYHDSQC